MYKIICIVRIEGKFKRESNNLLPIDYMYFGFKSIDLFISNFMYFNGLRIIMKPPCHPCKLGLYLGVNFKEYEHYTVSFQTYYLWYFKGHLLDTLNRSDKQFQSYEIPITLLMNDRIRSKVV